MKKDNSVLFIQLDGNLLLIMRNYDVHKRNYTKLLIFYCIGLELSYVRHTVTHALLCCQDGLSPHLHKNITGCISTNN